MNRIFFKLFANCVIVKGANRAIICDLQRNKFVFIPISLFTLFDSDWVLDLQKIRSSLDKESLLALQEYIDLLNENEFIFNCSKKESKRFPKLNLDFDYPAEISNMVIDFNKESIHDFSLIINEFLIPTNCRHVQLRFFDEIKFDRIQEIIDEVNNSFIKSVEIIMMYSDYISNDFLSDWVFKNKKVKSITIHSANRDKIIKNDDYGFGIIVELKQNISSENHCGTIHHNYFNISTTKLNEVLENSNFKRYWNITKDQIEICKDCEFRHICTDCRAYIEEPDNQYSKPLKCGYNPYTNVWEEWSTNALKQKAIDYYGMKELIRENV